MQYFNQFIDAHNEYDYEGANSALISELACILLRHKQDFVLLLNESGISANEKMSFDKLIDLFFENIDSNKRLILGSAILVNIYNRDFNADGNEGLENEIVKTCYSLFDNRYCDATIMKPKNEFHVAVMNVRSDKKSAFNSAEEKKRIDATQMKLVIDKEINAERLQKLAAENKDAIEKQKKSTAIILLSLVGAAAIYAIFFKKR